MEATVPRLVVTNIVVSGSVEGVDIYRLFGKVPDVMGGSSKKETIYVPWRDKFYRVVINVWRTNSILIRIVPQEEQEDGGYIDVESDKDIIELVNMVGKELVMLIADRLGYRRYIEIVTHGEIATKLNIQNVVTQAMLPRCVDLDKLYMYIEGARPPCLSARYRSGRGRGQIPALLIYCETPSYRVTVELFRTGRFQAKGASKLSDLEEVVEKMISVIEASGSYFEC
jgi:TATA-box binding protein (TBP) (component of TFIID and TFIIIB)